MTGQPSTLVGRARELAALAGVLERAADARGAVALVTGEPGIGKTTLLDRTAAVAAERGFTVAWGRAWEAGGAPPHWIWVEALRPLVDTFGGPAADRARALVLDAAERVPDSFHLCDAVAQFARAAAERAPLLFVFDDLHAADVASLQIALFVARQLGGARIAIIGSYRDVEARLEPAVEDALAKIARVGETLSVGRLDRDEVSQLVREAVGVTDADVADMIMNTTEGNPLFVRELLRLIQARAGTKSGVPAGVRAVIRERLALLSPATVALLQAAAVVGRECSIALAAAVAGVTREALEEAAAEAASAALVEPAAPGRLRFSHALVAETLAENLPAPARARMHYKAAETLEATHAGDPAAPVVEIAHHWLQAGGAAAERAVAAAERAAAATAERLAFADAAHLLERAGTALQVAAPADSRRRAELLLARCDALARAGRRSEAETVCQQAAALARTLDDGALFARVALALGAELVLGNIDTEVRRLLEEAFDRLPAGDSELRVRVTARLAGARQPAPDVREPIAQAREAIDMARRLGDDQVLLYALYAGMGAMADYVPATERLPLNREAATLAAALGNGPYEVRARARILFDCVELMDARGFDAALTQLRALVDRLGVPVYRWIPTMFECMRAEWQGRFSEADELYTRAAEQAPDGIPLFHLKMRQLMSMCYRDIAGSEAREREIISAMHKVMPRMATIGAAWFDARHGSCTDVASAREQLLLIGMPTSHLHVHAILAVSDFAWHMGDRELAAGLLDVVVPRLGSSISLTGIGYILETTIDRVCMQMAIVCERWDDMNRYGETALALAETMSARPLIAHTCADWAAGIRRSGLEPQRAGELARRALAIAEQLGMSRLAQRCRTIVDAAPQPADNGAPLSFELAGDYWTVRGFGEVCRMKHSRGMQMLSTLVARPGEDIHVLELSGARQTDTGDAGELLDDKARDAYRQRIGELQAEIDDAETCNDPGRRERAEAELDALTAELSRAFGMGGRKRRAGNAVERARSNVRRRIADAMRKIGAAAPAIGDHLDHAVRTGIHCSYSRGD